MKCLVTGGAGFIGSHLTDALISRGHKVIVIDNLSTGLKLFVNKKAAFYKSDIRDFKKIEKYFKGVSAVFHAAANPNVRDSIAFPLETHSTNVTGTLNVLEASRQGEVKKFVMFSSCAVYGEQKKLPISESIEPNPVSPYGLHKLIGEQYVRIYAKLYGMGAVCLRLFNVYGPRSRPTGAYPMVIPTFISRKKAGLPLTIIGSGKQTRDFVNVKDVVEALISAADSDVNDGRCVNIGSGKETSILDIAGFVGGRKIHLPETKGEILKTKADITLAKKLFGWEPRVALKDGIAELVSVL